MEASVSKSVIDVEVENNPGARCTCIDKVTDARGTVRKFVLQFEDGSTTNVNNKQVKELLKSGNVMITNLKIGKNNKVVDCEDGDGNYILMYEKFISQNKQNILDTFKDDVFECEEKDTGRFKEMTLRGTKAHKIHGGDFVVVVRLTVTNEAKACSVKFEALNQEERIGTYNCIVNENATTSIEVAQVLNKFIALEKAGKFALDCNSDILNPTLEQCEELVERNIRKFFEGFEFSVRKGKKDGSNTVLRIYESKDDIVRVKVDKFKVRIVLRYANDNRFAGQIKMNLVSNYSYIEYNTTIESVNHAGIYKAFETFMYNSREVC